MAVLLLGGLGLLFLAGPGAPAARAGDGWWGGLDEGEAVSLADVIRGPQPYRGRVITFFAIFHTAAGRYRYYPPNTGLTAERYINFSVWPDGAPVWDKDTFVDDFPFLYLPATHAQRDELLGTARCVRLEITGRIRTLLRGRPAIEVFSFRPTGHRLGWGVVRDVMWAMNEVRVGTRATLQSAARRLRNALQPDLPPVYAIRVRKMLADVLRRLGRPDEAAAYERGETVGMPPLPASDRPEGTPPDFFPPEGPAGFPPAAPGPTRSGSLGSPDGAPSGSPDGAAPGAPKLPQPPSLPQPPGAPLPPTGKLPGNPVASGGQAPAAPQLPAPPEAAPPARHSAIPPRRKPRLSGVK
jgi:hypothetical protein